MNNDFDKQDDSGKNSRHYLPEDDKSCFKLKLVTENNVIKAISRLKNRHTFGLGKISCYIFLVAAPVVLRSLPKVFNVSIKTGIFPTRWKYAKVATIFKGGVKGKQEIIDEFLFYQLLPRYMKG